MGAPDISHADYFAVATAIVRKDAEKRFVAPCRCGLYSFPHRRSDRCDDAEREALDVQAEMQTQADWDAEELALFDRAEARAINRGW